MTRRKDGADEPEGVAELAAIRKAFLALLSGEAEVGDQTDTPSEDKAETGDPGDAQDLRTAQELFAAGRDLALVAASFKMMGWVHRKSEEKKEADMTRAAEAEAWAAEIEELVKVIAMAVAFFMPEDEEEAP